MQRLAPINVNRYDYVVRHPVTGEQHSGYGVGRNACRPRRLLRLQQLFSPRISAAEMLAQR
jgi:hypothetical protein